MATYLSAVKTFQKNCLYTLHNIFNVSEDGTTTSYTGLMNPSANENDDGSEIKSGVYDLSSPTKVFPIQESAISGTGVTQTDINNSLKNYAYFKMRDKILTAAQEGKDYVDIEWTELVSAVATQLSASRLKKAFLGLETDSNGNYKDWDPPRMIYNNGTYTMFPTATEGATMSPWWNIVKEISGYVKDKNQNNQDITTSGHQNHGFVISYLYTKNEKIPYAVRIQWGKTDADGNHSMTTVKTDYDGTVKDYEKFLIDNQNAILTSKSKASTDSTTVLKEFNIVSAYITICDRLIQTAAASGKKWTPVYWEQFGQQKDAIIKTFITSPYITGAADKSYSAYNLLTIKVNAASEFTIYENEIIYGARKHEYRTTNEENETYKYTSYTAQTLLTNASYQAFFPQQLDDQGTSQETTITYSDDSTANYNFNLKNEQNGTYDGFIICWSNTKAVHKEIKTFCEEYRNLHKLIEEDTNVYLTIAEGHEMNDQQDLIFRQIKDKQIQRLSELIYSKLISAFQLNEYAAGILFTEVDATLYKSVGNYIIDDEVAYTGTIAEKIKTNNSTELTTVIAPDKDTDASTNIYTNGYIGTLDAMVKQLSATLGKTSCRFVKINHSHDTPITYDTKQVVLEKDSNGNTTKSGYTGKVKFSSASGFANEYTYYWDYIYYKNKYFEEKEDSTSRKQWILRNSPDPQAKPAGIVVQLGEKSDQMLDKLWYYANKVTAPAEET